MGLGVRAAGERGRSRVGAARAKTLGRAGWGARSGGAGEGDKKYFGKAVVENGGRGVNREVRDKNFIFMARQTGILGIRGMIGGMVFDKNGYVRRAPCS